MGEEISNPGESMTAVGALLSPEFAYHWFQRLDSTNELALAKSWPHGTIIATDCQDKGRGRLGRIWHSPPGVNLYFSLIFFPSLPAERWGGYSLAVGAFLGQALTPLLPGIGLKWPNDLYVAGKKVGGVLLETKEKKLVAGIGLNVNQSTFPSGLNAGSLRLFTGGEWRRDKLLAILIPSVFAGLKAWDRGDATTVIATWRELDILLGQQVEARWGGRICHGRAAGIGSEGQLILVDKEGNRVLLHSGEVTLAKS